MSESVDDQWQDGEDINKVHAYSPGLGIRVKQEVWDKVHGWCRAADSEVSGLGLVKKDALGLYVYDVFLLDQECSGVSTELQPKAVAKLMSDLHKQKIPLSHLRFWWHTHYDFQVFWSGTDVDTCEKLAGSSAEWMLSLVVNQKGDYKCRVDIMNPVRVAIDDLTVEVPETVDPAAIARYKKEVQDKVKESYSYTSVAPNYGGYGAGGGTARRAPGGWRPASKNADEAAEAADLPVRSEFDPAAYSSDDPPEDASPRHGGFEEDGRGGGGGTGFHFI